MITVKLQWKIDSKPTYHEVETEKEALRIIENHKNYFIAEVFEDYDA